MRLGTRGSQLALWQAREVARLIESAAGRRCEIVVIRTSGDRDATTSTSALQHPAAGERETPPSSTGSRPDVGARLPAADPSVKRLFVKELEDALLEGRIDVAVHSSKDMPVELPAELAIGATLPRDDPRDAVLLPQSRATATVADLDAILNALGPSPRIGTSSIRRVAQFRTLLPAASFIPIRGNVDTRIRKLDSGECDLAVLASAGLRRLGYENRISCAVPIDRSVPAPGQGIIAVELHSDRRDMADVLARITDAASADALAAERAVVDRLGGGCQLPIGAFAEVDADELRITGVVIAPDASHVVRQKARGPRSEAVAVGVALADALLASGAGAILDAVRNRCAPLPEAAP